MDEFGCGMIWSLFLFRLQRSKNVPNSSARKVREMRLSTWSEAALISLNLPTNLNLKRLKLTTKMFTKDSSFDCNDPKCSKPIRTEDIQVQSRGAPWNEASNSAEAALTGLIRLSMRLTYPDLCWWCWSSTTGANWPGRRFCVVVNRVRASCPTNTAVDPDRTAETTAADL